MSDMNKEEVTEKQLHFIKDIETYTGTKFTGTTKYEARKFIQENKDAFYKEKREEINGKLHCLLRKGV